MHSLLHQTSATTQIDKKLIDTINEISRLFKPTNTEILFTNYTKKYTPFAKKTHHLSYFSGNAIFEFCVAKEHSVVAHDFAHSSGSSFWWAKLNINADK